MERSRTWMTVVMALMCLSAQPPALAVLLDDGPERVLFQGPREGLWLRVLRRRTSYAIHAYRQDRSRPPHGLDRSSWVGLVEGSTTGLMLDPRALAAIRRRCPPGRPVPAIPVAGMNRYRIETDDWIVGFTSRERFVPTEAHRTPERVTSQFLSRPEWVQKLETLSRNIDPIRLVWRPASRQPGPAIGLPILTPARPAGGLEGIPLNDPMELTEGRAPAPPEIPRLLR